MAKVFVTGGTGFLGCRVVQRLCALGRHGVVLARRQTTGSPPSGDGIEFLSGDLLHPDSYAERLASADLVLHMAALTGKASRSEHFRANAQGTEVLIKQCVLAGTRNFVFISSIAAKFKDKTRYYYAQAKAHAEEVVRASGLTYTIVRPTVIVGPGSPSLAALARLVNLPIMPIFGDGRARVQPIYIEDLVDFIMIMLDEPRYRGQTLEFGGPSALSIEDFIQAIRRVRRGRRGAVVHVPLRMLLPVLGAVESFAYRVLPLTVGQLASFHNDGTIASNELYERRRATLRDVHQMLALSLSK